LLDTLKNGNIKSKKVPRYGANAGQNYMYKIYILQSLKNKRHYIGQTLNIDKRLEKHNSGQVKSTKSFCPWKLIYTENYKTRSEACKREIEIKKYKSGIKFKKLLGIWEN